MKKRSEVGDEPKRVTIPVDVINEQILLAAAVVLEGTERVRLLQRVSSDKFFTKEYGLLWDAMRDLYKKGLTFSYDTLQTIVGTAAVPVSKLRELVELHPVVPENLDFHITALQWDRLRINTLTGPVVELSKALQDPSESPARVRALARSVSTSFENTGSNAFLLDSKKLVGAQIREVQERIDGHAVYAYGIEGLDYYPISNGRKTRRMIPGCAPGQITIVSGVPGGGKSTLISRMVLGIAAQGKRILYGAWEQSGGPALELLATFHLGWSRAEMLDPELAEANGRPLNQGRKIKLEETMHFLSKNVVFASNPFRRSDEKRRTNEHNLDVIRGLISDSMCDVFVADLWARCLVSAKPDEEAEALFVQQAMLAEYGVHGILAHQQRFKDVETRPSKRPTREGLKGSGAYLEVADTALGVHRPAHWKNMPDDQIEIYVLKQRYGKWPIAVRFEWDAEYGRITGGEDIKYSAEDAVGDDFTRQYDANMSKKPGYRNRS